MGNREAAMLYSPTATALTTDVRRISKASVREMSALVIMSLSNSMMSSRFVVMEIQIT